MVTWGPYNPTDGANGDRCGVQFFPDELWNNVGTGTDGSPGSTDLGIDDRGPTFRGYGWNRGATAGKNGTDTNDCFFEVLCNDDPNNPGGGDVWAIGICQNAQFSPFHSNVTEGYMWRLTQWWGQSQLVKNGTQVSSQGGWGTSYPLGVVRLEHDGAGHLKATLNTDEQVHEWTDTGAVLTNTDWGTEMVENGIDYFVIGDNGAPPVGTNLLRVGADTPDDYRMGAVAVDRIYNGDTLVYEP